MALLAFSEAATIEIAAERTADPGNSSLVAAYTEIQAQHEQELNQLIQMADALENWARKRVGLSRGDRQATREFSLSIFLKDEC